MPRRIRTAQGSPVLEPNFPWLELIVSVSMELVWAAFVASRSSPHLVVELRALRIGGPWWVPPHYSQGLPRKFAELRGDSRKTYPKTLIELLWFCNIVFNLTHKISFLQIDDHAACEVPHERQSAK
jgi:hypothetical protein